MITGAVLGAICGPFISALLYGLRRAGRALTRLIRPHTRSHPMTFHYTDPDGDRIEISAGLCDAATGQPILSIDSITITVIRKHDDQPATVYVPVDRIEELIAGLRDTARQAVGGPR